MSKDPRVRWAMLIVASTYIALHVIAALSAPVFYFEDATSDVFTIGCSDDDDTRDRFKMVMGLSCTTSRSRISAVPFVIRRHRFGPHAIHLRLVDSTGKASRVRIESAHLMLPDRSQCELWFTSPRAEGDWHPFGSFGIYWAATILQTGTLVDVLDGSTISIRLTVEDPASADPPIPVSIDCKVDSERMRIRRMSFW